MLNPYGYPGAPSVWDLIMQQRNALGGNFGSPTQTYPGWQIPQGGGIPGQGFSMRPGAPNLPVPYQQPGMPQVQQPPMSVQQVPNAPQNMPQIGGPPQRPMLPPPQSGPQINMPPYQPQNTGAPSQPPAPGQAPGTPVNVPGLLSNIASYLKVPMAGPVGAYAAMTGPADTGEDPNLAARVKGAGYDPLSSIKAPGKPVREDRSAKEPPAGRPSPQTQPRHPSTPTPKSARTPQVPLPPERPQGLLSQDPSFLQRLMSGQWTGPIDQSMVLPNDWMNGR